MCRPTVLCGKTDLQNLPWYDSAMSNPLLKSTGPTTPQLFGYLGAIILFIIFTWFFSVLFSQGFTWLDQKYYFLGILAQPIEKKDAVSVDEEKVFSAFVATNSTSSSPLSEEEKVQKIQALEKVTSPSTLSAEQKMKMLQALQK